MYSHTHGETGMPLFVQGLGSNSEIRYPSGTFPSPPQFYTNDLVCETTRSGLAYNVEEPDYTEEQPLEQLDMEDNPVYPQYIHATTQPTSTTTPPLVITQQPTIIHPASTVYSPPLPTSSISLPHGFETGVSSYTVPLADTRSQRPTMYNTAEPTIHSVQQPVYHSQPLPQQPMQLTYCQPPVQSIQSQFVQPQLTCFQPPAQSMQPPPYYQTPAMYYQHPFPQPMYHGGYYAALPAAPAPTMPAASTIAPTAAQARNNPLNDLTALKDFIEQVANKDKKSSCV